jgi:oxygen-dependent protoporphyrinogen oxidase
MAVIAVAGGGISGLTAAYTLRVLGHDVTLIDERPTFGGVIQTEQVDGLLIDQGPDSFLSSKPAALELVRQLGLSDRIVCTRPDGGGTFILHHGELTPLPEGLTMLVPAQLRQMAETRLLSRRGKLRMGLEYFVPARRGDDDESIGQFVRRRLGNEAFENIAEPLLSGIYSGDADQLSLAATFPRMREVEQRYGGLVRGTLAQRRNPRPAAGSDLTPFVSLRNGLGELTGALVEALDDADLRAGSRVTNLERANGGYRLDLSDGAVVEADGVLLALPAHGAADLLRAGAPELAARLDEIHYASSATISLAFDECELPAAQAGRGFVVPRVEGLTLKAVTWTSNKFAGRAPEGTALLRGFVGRAGDEAPVHLPDDQLIAVVRRELAAVLGITSEPHTERVYRWLRASPQYNVGHLDRVAEIEAQTARQPRLALTGSAYRGIGIPDCIQNATAVAQQLARQLS